MTLGQRLRKHRLRLGMSVRQLEEVSGVSRGLISKLERDQRPQVSLEVAKQLALALGITLDYLAGMYTEEDEPEPVSAMA